jgi:nucleotide-binding universal stress UspA family protein
LTSDLAEVPGISVGMEHLTLAVFQREYEEQARQRLKDAVPETVAAYSRVESTMVRGKPRHEIVRIATERDVDLVVMGVQGRGAVDRMLFGSTTQHVIRECACPVLTLR